MWRLVQQRLCDFGKWRINFALLIFVVLNFNTAYSQCFSKRFEHFSTAEGLSSSQVTSIYQDSRGYLWIGTSDGLNRYDGYGFKVFRHHPMDSTSISGNFIQSIEEVPNGNIWVGTKNSGISIWNKNTGLFEHLSKIGGETNPLPEKGIYGLKADSLFAWVKMKNFIAKVHYNHSAVKVIGHYSTFFKAERFHNYPIVENCFGVWFGSKDGLHLLNDSVFSVQRIVDPINLSDMEIAGLVPVDSHNLVIGSREGLWYFDINSEKLSLLNSTISNAGIKCLYKDGEHLFIGTEKGLFLSSAPYKVAQPLLKASDTGFDFEVSSIFVDRSGIVWIGTLKNGLIKFNQKPTKFHSISVYENDSYSIGSYDFESVLVDRHNKVWLGTSNDGVYQIDRGKKKIKKYSIKASDGDVNPPVFSQLEDHNGNFWFGTDKGIYVLEKGSSSIVEFNYSYREEFKTLLQTNKVKSIIQDQLGNIWFGTQFGLYRYNGTWIDSFFADDDRSTSLCHDEVNVLFEDSDGWIWIGTNDGINVYSASDEMFLKLRNEPNSEMQISYNIILSFAEDLDKKIIIGTQSGLSYYDKTIRKSGFWLGNQDLIDGKVYAIEVDSFNKVWISTGKGILAFIPGETVMHFNKKDGIPDYNFNIGSSFKYNDTELFFGGDKGLTIIKSDSIAYNLVKPKVLVTDITVYSKGKIVERYENDIKEVTVRYRSNSMIRIEFAGMEFTQPLYNSFQVFLEGYDEEPREISNQNFVNISNLPAGNYVLKVNGANSDFVWNNIPTELKITVEPPLYMSNYAYVFYFIFGVFLIQVLVNYRIRHYRKAYKELNEKSHDKKKIEAQKEALSKFNKSLTDSISYAKRIQEAMIPSEEMIREILPDSFVYFRPKDIVSGDFYWVYDEGDKVFVSVVDCTGHGVPGAFMSIIGFDLLRNIVEVQGEKSPDRILSILNEGVVNTFNKKVHGSVSKTENVNDGMDMALILIDKKEQVIEFAGANNPLYIMRDNEILTVKGNRRPIGYQSELSESEQFSKQIIPYQSGDIVYLFTDGYADQFGGAEGKKFKYRRFRHLLLNIHKLPIDDQKTILHQKMEEWMGSEYEQIDDICLVGIKL